MRILMISHAADRTGAPISALQLAKAMTAQGHELKIILRRDGELGDAYRTTAQTYTWREDMRFDLLDGFSMAVRFDPIMAAKCLRTPDRPYCLGRHDRKRITGIRRDILNWQPEIIYANTTHCGDIIDDLDLNLPIVTHVREMGPTIKGLDPRRRKSALDKSDMFLCASRSVMDDLARDFAVPAAKLQIEPPAVEITTDQIAAAETARAEVDVHLGLNERDTLILGAGSLILRKGPDLFVQAAQTAIEAHTGPGRMVFAWLGDGPMMPELQQEVQNAGLPESILFPGLVTGPFPYIRRASALLVTSREDPYPRVAIEAGALGIPVLAFSGGGGAADLVRDYDAGDLVADFDATAIGRVVGKLIMNRESPDNNLSKRVSEGHNPSASASRMVTLFKSLAETLCRT